MPTYEYRCQECAFQQDILQKISEQPLETCPQCGKSSFRRGPGGGQGLMFKGSGFYITDYANKKASQSDSSSSSTSSQPAQSSK